jgi:long-chain fatty acid transport protein
MTKVAFAALNIEPSVGVALGENWALGLGVDIQYAAFEQNIAVNRPLNQPDGQAVIDGDSWQVGASVSVLWEYNEHGRLGLRYRSPMAHELSGDMTAIGERPASTDLTIPQNLTLSVYQPLSPAWALLLDAGWQNWGAFDKTIITVDGENQRQLEILREFKDTWTGSLGVHWRTSPDWLLMAGLGYTSSAVDDDKRTPDMPADKQIRASLGAEHEFDAKWRIGFNYTYLWLGNNAIDAQGPPLTGRVVGDYDAKAYVFGIYGSLRI